MLRFTVLPCDAPCILGMDFLKTCNPNIDWRSGQICFRVSEVSKACYDDDNGFAGLECASVSEEENGQISSTCGSTPTGPRYASQEQGLPEPAHNSGAEDQLVRSFTPSKQHQTHTKQQDRGRVHDPCKIIDQGNVDIELVDVLRECNRVGGFEVCWQAALQAKRQHLTMERLYCPKCNFPHLDQQNQVKKHKTHLCLNNTCKHIFEHKKHVVGNPLADIMQQKQQCHVARVCVTDDVDASMDEQNVFAVQSKVAEIERCNVKTFQRGLNRGDYVEAYFVHAQPEQQQCNFTHRHAHGVQGAGDKTTLQKEQQAMLQKLKNMYPTMFEEPTYPIKRENNELFEHKIELKDPTADPPKKRLYPLDAVELAALKEQLDLFLQTNRIVPSSSPYGAPILFAKKKDGKLRMCIDYRMLNKNTTTDSYPLPRIDELLARIGGAHVFSKLDLRDGYHQLPMRDQDRAKTAFSTRYGQFEWTVMPFGLCNAPSTFQRVMHTVFFDLLDVCVLIYLDDILIFSPTIEEHRKHLAMVFEKLHKNNLYIKESKCALFLESVEFLGHRIDKNGVSVEEGKTDAIKNWAVPQNVNQVQQFLGLANYYRKFIRNFAKIASPLTDLTKKAIAWQWGACQQSAFEKLKQLLVSAPCLKVFDQKHKTRIWTDASDLCVGAVLEQLDGDDQWHPVEFFSKKLSAAQTNYSATERELLAVFLSLERWRQYLIGIHFTVYTDHASLQYLHTQARLGRRQARWLDFFGEFDFSVEHVSGKTNVVADALSCVVHTDNTIPCVNTCISDTDGYANTMVQQSNRDIAQCVDAYAVISLNDEQLLLQQIRDSQLQHANDLYMQKCTSACTERSEKYALRNGIVCKLVGDVYAPVIPPADNSLKLLLLKEVHNSALGGHMGYFKMNKLIQKRFWWKGLRADVRKFIAQCNTCQANKTSTQRTPGLLQPHVVPTKPFEHVTMDFIVQLPTTKNGFDSIFAIIDRFSKYTILIPTNTDISAVQTAQLFFDNCVCKFGMPDKIISDRDTKFQSVFWQSLIKLLNCKINMSSAYHPQTDGQTERFNRSVEQIIRCYISPAQDDWDMLLQQVCFVLNNSVHQGTQHTPFQTLYGFQPSLPLDHALSQLHNNKNPTAADFVTARSRVHAAVKANLQRYNETMQRSADKHRRPLEFAEGDRVWLYTTNLRLPGKLTRKFAAKWVGPYRVSERVSSVAYRLELPSELRGVHPVFHVSLLKPHVGEVPAARRPVFIGGEPEYEVEAIVAKRLGGRGTEYLVHWKGYSDFDQTWEPAKHLTHAPDIVAEFEGKMGRT